MYSESVELQGQTEQLNVDAEYALQNGGLPPF